MNDKEIQNITENVGRRRCRTEEIDRQAGQKIKLSFELLLLYIVFLKNRSISTAARVMLYNLAVKFNLGYNIAALSTTQQEVERLKAARRAQLRSFLPKYTAIG